MKITKLRWMKGSLIKTIYMIVTILVMIFVSITYSSLTYNDKILEICENGYKQDAIREYNFTEGPNVENRVINRDALEKISRNCEYKIWFTTTINSEEARVSVSYIHDKAPEISIYDENTVKRSEIDKAYVGRSLRGAYKDSINIVGKNYEIGEVIGVRGKTDIIDRALNIYTNNIEDIYNILSKADMQTSIFRFYLSDNGYEDYDKDIRRLLTGSEEITEEDWDKQFLVKTSNRKEETVNDIDYGITYISLIMVGIITMVLISYFWIDYKRKDIAVKRAFGAKKRHIIGEIYRELLGMCIISGFLAYIIGYFIKIKTLNLTWARVSVSLNEVVYFIIAIILISSLTAVIPIIKTIKSQIILELKGR